MYNYFCAVLYFSLTYNKFFGGAIAATRAQFEAINGFSTEYYGWGKEDDDMLLRYRIK